MHKSRMRLLSLTLALGMSVMAGAGGLSMETAAREYTDREQVLDTGFTLDTEYTLKLANPSEDISTTAANYYITGSSDPDSPLSCNGEEVGKPRRIRQLWHLCRACDGGKHLPL